METESLIAQYEQAYDKLLPPPIAERAKWNLRAAVTDARTTYPRLPLVDPQLCVDTGFGWGLTPEQDGFWYSVSRAVRRSDEFPSVKTLR